MIIVKVDLPFYLYLFFACQKAEHLHEGIFLIGWCILKCWLVGCAFVKYPFDYKPFFLMQMVRSVHD